LNGDHCVSPFLLADLAQAFVNFILAAESSGSIDHEPDRPANIARAIRMAMRESVDMFYLLEK
jgi:hypothetical protein